MHPGKAAADGPSMWARATHVEGQMEFLVLDPDFSVIVVAICVVTQGMEDRLTPAATNTFHRRQQMMANSYVPDIHQGDLKHILPPALTAALAEVGTRGMTMNRSSLSWSPSVSQIKKTLDV